MLQLGTWHFETLFTNPSVSCIACHVSCFMCHISLVTWRMSRDMSQMSHGIITTLLLELGTLNLTECSPSPVCHVSQVTYHVSLVTLHMSASCVTCHKSLSHVTSLRKSISCFLFYVLTRAKFYKSPLSWNFVIQINFICFFSVGSKFKFTYYSRIFNESHASPWCKQISAPFTLTDPKSWPNCKTKNWRPK